MICSSRVKLRGGYAFTVRASRGEHTCHVCGKPIPRSRLYVEERSVGGAVYRYHFKCLEQRYPHLLRVEVTPSGTRICLLRESP